MRIQALFNILFIYALSSQAFSILYAYERFLSWESVVAIKPDSSLDVEEKITVFSTGDTVKRGITREFPTKYRSKGKSYTVAFDVKSVMHNGRSAAYHIQDLSNGKRILIGQQHVFISPGVHTYTIRYTTDRQLGFFEKHDELYWNVIGNDVRLPVEHISVTVRFPKPIPRSQVTAEAYTGTFGAQGRDYQVVYSSPENTNTLVANTTVNTINTIVDSVTLKNIRPLEPGQAFTIVVTWPKGIVKPPSAFENFIYFLKDNWPLGWLLGIVSVALWWYLRAWRRLRKFKRPGTIIPLFEPPKNLSAAAISYLANMKVNSTVFASSFIDIAVRGLLEIEYKPRGWFSSETYKLIRNIKPMPEDFFPEYQALLSGLSLYSAGRDLTVKHSEQQRLAKGYQALEKNLKADYGIPYIQDTSSVFSFVFTFSAVAILLLFFLSLWSPTLVMVPVLVIGIVLLVFITIVFSFVLKAYTREGRKLMDEIEGFKLFLSTTETERLKVIGTPPTRTPELYEKYLPYAVALGVEEQWSQQFVPVFERLRKQGVEYQPIWYHGPHTTSFARSFAPQAFAQNLSSSLKTSVTSSGTIPGSYSGSGGGGRAGGGGGGGGAGGW